MPRRPRDLDSSTWFHVTNRGYDRHDIFHTDRDRLLFEALMVEAFDRHRVTLHAYALMTNHFHLLVECADGDVSSAVQRMTARYAAAFNDRRRRTGPLFTGRFWSGPIMSEEQRFVTGLYVHRNPLAFVPPAALTAYRWSSLGCYTGRRARPRWLETDILLPDGDGDHYLEEVLAVPTVGPNCDRIVEVVADVARVPGDDIRAARRGISNVARAAAILVAVESKVAPLPDLATYFGLADVRGVSQVASRARLRLASDAGLAQLVETVDRRLGLSTSGSVPDVLKVPAA